MTLTYQDWNEPYGEPFGEPYTEEVALKKFLSDEEVTVLVGDASSPETVLVIDLGGREIEAMWLDKYNRPTVAYTWSQPSASPGWPKGRIMLTRALLAEYDHEQSLPQARISRSEVISVQPDGSFMARKVDFITGEEFMMEGVKPEQLQVQDVPEFGDWKAFLDINRSI